MILERDRRQTLVIFRNAGIKKFATSEAVFDVIEGERNKKKCVA